MAEKDHDLKPSPIPHVEKKRGQSFDDAMNPPNDPEKRNSTDSYNINNDYDDDNRGV